MVKRDTVFWTALFGLLTALSLDYWWWGAVVRLGPAGLPTWIYYFVLLQFVLAICVYVFAQRYWSPRNSDGKGDDG